MNTTHRSFRYDTCGNWYKGNTHIHSTVSDGGKDSSELALIYSEAGYDFLFHTDHWVPSRTDDCRDRQPLLWLDGVELDGCDDAGSKYHIVCLGSFDGLYPEMEFLSALHSVKKQGGILILAHPEWMGNSLDDTLIKYLDGVEIYNHVTRWLNGKGDGLMHWNTMLSRSARTLGFAVDDAHITKEHPGWNGGWIVVNARKFTKGCILDAIRAGNCYSSCGPEIHSLQFQENMLTVVTSPVQFMRLVGPGCLGTRIGSFDGELVERAEMETPEDWPYVYLEIEDNCGRRAWTNSLLLSEEK